MYFLHLVLTFTPHYIIMVKGLFQCHQEATELVTQCKRHQPMSRELINLVLPCMQEERKVATSRLMLAAVAVAALAVAFSIGIVCTERPPKHKPSIE